MSTLRKFAHALLPERIFEKLHAVRSRRYQVRLLAREGILDATARYIERNGLRVRYGPFAGMTYPRDAALGRISIPKLLGTYEQELHPVLDVIGKRKYDVVIDIGSAEGYYAVGLARLLSTKVLAFDPEPRERRFCLEAASLNGVSQLVQLRDLFFASDVKTFENLRVLCICDCEGFESQIFNNVTVACTRNWDVLIELHGDAHSIVPALPWPQKLTLIEAQPRTDHFFELDQLGDPEKLLSEYRPTSQKWLWCDRQETASV